MSVLFSVNIIIVCRFTPCFGLFWFQIYFFVFKYHIFFVKHQFAHNEIYPVPTHLNLWCTYVSLCGWSWRYFSLFKERVPFTLTNLKFPLPIYFYKGIGLLFFAKLNSIYPRVFCDKFGWNWFVVLEKNFF